MKRAELEKRLKTEPAFRRAFMKENARPCPFCGATPKIEYNPDFRPELPEPFWSVGCPGRPRNCTGNPMSFGKIAWEALDRWNVRTTPKAHVCFSIIAITARDSICEGIEKTEAAARATVERMKPKMIGVQRWLIESITSTRVATIPGTRRKLTITKPHTQE